jgi:hypothetical protein
MASHGVHPTPFLAFSVSPALSAFSFLGVLASVF